jgi:hypothetical protein
MTIKITTDCVIMLWVCVVVFGCVVGVNSCKGTDIENYNKFDLWFLKSK